MTTGPFRWYRAGLLAVSRSELNYLTDTIRAAILDTAHTPAVDTHANLSDVVANEASSGDYARQVLGTKTVAVVSGKVRFGAANINFGSDVTIAGRYLVLFKDTGTAATSTLLAIKDMQTEGGNLSSTNSDFRIELPSGILEIEPNPA